MKVKNDFSIGVQNLEQTHSTDEEIVSPGQENDDSEFEEFLNTGESPRSRKIKSQTSTIIIAKKSSVQDSMLHSINQKQKKYVPKECQIDVDDAQIGQIGKEILAQAAAGNSGQNISMIKRMIKEKQAEMDFLVRVAQSRINSQGYQDKHAKKRMKGSALAIARLRSQSSSPDNQVVADDQKRVATISSSARSASVSPKQQSQIQNVTQSQLNPSPVAKRREDGGKKLPVLSAALNYQKVKHYKRVQNGKPTGNYFIIVNKQEQPTIERMIDYQERIQETREGKFGLKSKEKFGDVLFNPQLERLQHNLQDIIGKHYKKSKTRDAKSSVNWLKNLFIDAMVKEGQAHSCDSEDGESRYQQIITDIKKKSQREQYGNLANQQNDESLLIKLSTNSRYADGYLKRKYKQNKYKPDVNTQYGSNEFLSGRGSVLDPKTHAMLIQKVEFGKSTQTSTNRLYEKRETKTFEGRSQRAAKLRNSLDEQSIQDSQMSTKRHWATKHNHTGYANGRAARSISQMDMIQKANVSKPYIPQAIQNYKDFSIPSIDNISKCSRSSLLQQSRNRGLQFLDHYSNNSPRIQKQRLILQPNLNQGSGRLTSQGQYEPNWRLLPPMREPRKLPSDGPRRMEQQLNIVINNR